MGRGATLYLRSMPESLVREAKALAARRGVTLATLVSEALQRVVAAGGAPSGSGSGARPTSRRGPGDALAEDLRWFEANRTRLLGRYRDRYVAIHRGRIIDHDRDFDALARRVFARLGPGPVCMPKVTAQERVVHLPSPRLAKRS